MILSPKDMRYAITFILLLVTRARQSVSTTLPEGFSNYWPLDEDNGFSDIGDGAYGATLSGTQSFITDRFGRYNSAVYFDGSTYAWGSSTGLPTAARTISFWFKPDSVTTPSGQGLTPFAYGGGNCGTSFFLRLKSGAVYEMQGHCKAYQMLSSTTSSPVGSWHHWVFSTGSSGSRIYIDGTLIASSSAYITNTNVANKAFSIGVTVGPGGGVPYTDSTCGYFYGGIDDLTIWDEQLTDEKITAIYENEPPEFTNNEFILNEGISTLITSDMLYASDSQTSLTYTVSDVSDGYFWVGSASTPVTEFTQQQVLEESVYFKSVNSNLPAFNVKVSDGLLWTTTEANIVRTPSSSPTPNPTTLPIPGPTTSPVPNPTTLPIPGPTTSPVPNPTTLPIPGPTTSPVPNPTTLPIPGPTTSPVPNPTTLPIPGPTTSPAPNPTTLPIPGPTTSPVPGPTSSPAFAPTQSLSNDDELSDNNDYDFSAYSKDDDSPDLASSFWGGVAAMGIVTLVGAACFLLGKGVRKQNDEDVNIRAQALFREAAAREQGRAAHGHRWPEDLPQELQDGPVPPQVANPLPPEAEAREIGGLVHVI